MSAEPANVGKSFAAISTVGDFWDWLTNVPPHVSYSLAVVVLVVYRSRKAGRLPSEGVLIELLAYSSGIYAAILLGKDAGSDGDSHGHMPWAKMAAAIVLFLAAVKGTWRTLKRIKPREDAEQTVANDDARPSSPPSLFGGLKAVCIAWWEGRSATAAQREKPPDVAGGGGPPPQLVEVVKTAPAQQIVPPPTVEEKSAQAPVAATEPEQRPRTPTPLLTAVPNEVTQPKPSGPEAGKQPQPSSPTDKGRDSA